MSILGTRLEDITPRGQDETNQSATQAHPPIPSRRNGVLDKLISSISTFWRRQISLVSGSEECRDHFANERTFLGYLRTSSAFATLGIASCQLFLLDSGKTSCRGWYGKGLAFACETAAIVIALSGCWRFWRQQNAMSRGKVHAGGWELYTVGTCGFVIAVLALVLVLLANCDD